MAASAANADPVQPPEDTTGVDFAQASGGMSTADAAMMVANHRGRPTVVMIYSATCSRSRALMSELDQGGANGLPDVLAFSLHGSLPGPFATYPLAPYAPGELDHAMAAVGVRVGLSFTQPLITVLDADGRPIASWEGLTSVDPIRQAVAALRPAG